MNKFAISFGYLPSMDFTGFSRQLDDNKNILTIIINAFKSARLIKTDIDPEIQFSSRTDRGVSALNQIVSLKTDRTPIINEINAYLPASIRALAVNKVPFDFNPRHDAVLRIYSYFLAGNSNFDYSSVYESLLLIKGTHDFNNFSKQDPPKKKLTLREIKIAEMLFLGNNTYHIRIASKAFLWQQVRRIVGHLIEVSNGVCNKEHTKHLLTSRNVKFRPSPAPPDFLVLEKIEYENLQLEPDKKSLQIFQNTLKTFLIKNRTNTALYDFFNKSIMNYGEIM